MKVQFVQYSNRVVIFLKKINYAIANWIGWKRVFVFLSIYFGNCPPVLLKLGKWNDWEKKYNEKFQKKQIQIFYSNAFLAFSGHINHKRTEWQFFRKIIDFKKFDLSPEYTYNDRIKSNNKFLAKLLIVFF